MRLRVRYTKLGKIRFTSSRDAARIWERALRRAEVPVARSEGFTPRPKISFGLALPTGAESVAEYVDIDLRPDVRAAGTDLDSLVADLARSLSEGLPIGCDVLAAAIADGGRTSLQDSVTACTWELWHPQLTAEDHRRACELMSAPTLVLERERKGKRSADDVRPLILDLRYADVSESAPLRPLFAGGDTDVARPGIDGPRLLAVVSTVGRGLRPSELAELAYPGHDARDIRALRTHQWVDAVDPLTEPRTDGLAGRREVLPVDGEIPVAAAPQLATASAGLTPPGRPA